MLAGIFLIILIVMPCCVIVTCFITRNRKVCQFINLISSIVCFVCGIILVTQTNGHEYNYLSNYIYLDSLCTWVLLCTTTVYLLASMYSIGYITGYKDQANRLNTYYGFFAGFALVMFIGAIINNLILYWIAIDLTTIVSTFLVCFRRTPESVEASWKYLVVVISGLSLAILGIVLFQWGLKSTPMHGQMLSWNTLKEAAPYYNVHLLRLAFILVLLGFGTKVGLAPMHTWLPDAHSEGPAPASAMLSGALLNTAMLGIVRFLSIVSDAGHAVFAHTLLVILGVISLLVAGFFIAKQNGVKRLMAYSSLEHMGVIGLGFGFGGMLGFAGAMYHMINHSLNKSVMFFGCGNAMEAYESKVMSGMRGILKIFPRSGLVWLLGAVAITGAPPGGLFLSELTIMRGGLASSNMWAVFIMLIMLIIIFCGFMMHFFQMYNEKPSQTALNKPKFSFWYFLPMFLGIIPLYIFGIWWPQGFWHYFTQTAHLYGVTP
jgi:hydrogenase-4 component F